MPSFFLLFILGWTSVWMHAFVCILGLVFRYSELVVLNGHFPTTEQTPKLTRRCALWLWYRRKCQPLASCQIRKIAGCTCAGNAGTFFPPPTSKEPQLSDPGMHHGTCVTHVPWCMLGSLTRGGGENVPGISGACATCNFAYLAKGPCPPVCARYVSPCYTGSRYCAVIPRLSFPPTESKARIWYAYAYYA